MAEVALTTSAIQSTVYGGQEAYALKNEYTPQTIKITANQRRKNLVFWIHLYHARILQRISFIGRIFTRTGRSASFHHHRALFNATVGALAIVSSVATDNIAKLRNSKI